MIKLLRKELLRKAILCYSLCMNRNSETEATVLALKQVGEQNRLVTLFTPKDGVITAVLYGGPKSKLRAMVSPYHRGRIWLYTDTVRKSCKISIPASPISSKKSLIQLTLNCQIHIMTSYV